MTALLTLLSACTESVVLDPPDTDGGTARDAGASPMDGGIDSDGGGLATDAGPGGGPDATVPMPPSPGGYACDWGPTDGPATLPSECVHSDVAETPSTGATHRVAAGMNAQAAIDAAACGDVVLLEAGASFPPITLRDRGCDDAHWITIRTDAPDESLPPEGVRMTPCYAGVASLPSRPAYACDGGGNRLAQILTSSTSAPAITLAAGASHYRLVGLEVTRADGDAYVALITLGARANHVVFDRMWIHGNAREETRRGIALGGSNHVAVVDSTFTDFHCIASTGSCSDSQAISGGLGNVAMGPYRIDGNFLEAAGEAVLFGGGGATEVPHDIEIRFNHFYKPRSWDETDPSYFGVEFIVKNHLELKNAQRVLIEGNLMEHVWDGYSQNGYSILLTPKNQSDQCSVCEVADVTIRYVIASHADAGISVYNAPSDTGAWASGGHRYSIHDIVLDDIRVYEGIQLGNSQSAPAASRLTDVTIDHVSIFGKNALMIVGAAAAHPLERISILSSIFGNGRYGFHGVGGGPTSCGYGAGPDIDIWTRCFDVSSEFADNLVFGSAASSSWPPGTFYIQFPTAADVEFVDWSGGVDGDYRLSPGGAGEVLADPDLGADIDLVETTVARAR
ncbi:MAG: hypothetical protein AB7S26_20780 [Sandaracinaceae bacterium]